MKCVVEFHGNSGKSNSEHIQRLFIPCKKVWDWDVKNWVNSYKISLFQECQNWKYLDKTWSINFMFKRENHVQKDNFFMNPENTQFGQFLMVLPQTILQNIEKNLSTFIQVDEKILKLWWKAQKTDFGK